VRKKAEARYRLLLFLLLSLLLLPLLLGYAYSRQTALLLSGVLFCPANLLSLPACFSLRDRRNVLAYARGAVFRVFTEPRRVFMAVTRAMITPKRQGWIYIHETTHGS